jgi:hypothetical protein
MAGIGPRSANARLGDRRREMAETMISGRLRAKSDAGKGRIDSGNAGYGIAADERECVGAG